jgi:murein L,D-transpeptidase YafK
VNHFFRLCGATVFSLLLLSHFLCSVAAAPLQKADKVLVFKKLKRMHLLHKGKVLKKYSIALGRNLKGHKQREGDYRTPEGVYSISEKKQKSQYHKALRISYPNEYDLENAYDQGVSPGGDIMIHGMPKKYARVRQLLPTMCTRGCIALPNAQMDEVWNLVDEGVEIEIRP